jgi:hypothetical protein
MTQLVRAVLAALIGLLLGAATPATAIAAVPGSTFDTAAYTYDAPVLLSAPDAEASYERASPLECGAVSRVSPAFVCDCGVATNSGVVSDAATSRVSLRVGTKLEIQANAEKTAAGDFIDPNTGAVIPREGPFDYGHKPGYEWWRTQRTATEQGWSRQDVIEYENDPTHYQIEDPSSNRSHAFEKAG